MWLRVEPKDRRHLDMYSFHLPKNEASEPAPAVTIEPVRWAVKELANSEANDSSTFPIHL
jgi:hypothetical protein